MRISQGAPSRRLHWSSATAAPHGRALCSRLCIASFFCGSSWSTFFKLTVSSSSSRGSLGFFSRRTKLLFNCFASVFRDDSRQIKSDLDSQPFYKFFFKKISHFYINKTLETEGCMLCGGRGDSRETAKGFLRFPKREDGFWVRK